MPTTCSLHYAPFIYLCEYSYLQEQKQQRKTATDSAAQPMCECTVKLAELRRPIGNGRCVYVPEDVLSSRGNQVPLRFVKIEDIPVPLLSTTPFAFPIHTDASPKPVNLDGLTGCVYKHWSVALIQRIQTKAEQQSITYNTTWEFNVDWKAECDQLNLAHLTKNKNI